jgi:hypothetical protein
MRRRTLLVTATLLSGAALVAILIFALASPPPYEFLSGQTAVVDEQVGPASGPQLWLKIYSFQGDFQKVRAAAEGELVKADYWFVTQPGIIDHGFHAAYMESPDRSRWRDGGRLEIWVDVLPDLVLTRANYKRLLPYVRLIGSSLILGDSYKRKPGWITVVVRSNEQKSPFALFWARLGL